MQEGVLTREETTKQAKEGKAANPTISLITNKEMATDLIRKDLIRTKMKQTTKEMDTGERTMAETEIIEIQNPNLLEKVPKSRNSSRIKWMW